MTDKYANPRAWLYARCEDYVRDGRADRLFNFLRPIVQDVDSDTIQDTYQAEMSDDGYFGQDEAHDSEACDECRPCESCGGIELGDCPNHDAFDCGAVD